MSSPTARTLTDSEREVIEAIRHTPNGITAAYVGQALWGRQHRLPQHWARPAGRILRRLEQRGMVYVRSERKGRQTWHLTFKGASEP